MVASRNRYTKALCRLLIGDFSVLFVAQGNKPISVYVGDATTEQMVMIRHTINAGEFDKFCPLSKVDWASNEVGFSLNNI
tara:strand:- start:244 stop:483 length:240 start_codon:yes stop_codon:yes gene_type:complete